MLSRFLKSAPVQNCLASLVGRYLSFALSTTRWQFDGSDHLRPLLPGNTPMIAAFWHECLPLMPAMFTWAKEINPAREVSVLVSRHRDGRFIGSAIAHFGMRTVHGSAAKPGKKADKGGAASLRALLAVLAKGEFVAITPDGPRGPKRQAAPGTASLAALSGAVILPCAAQIRARITLPTWDRMGLPLPFSRGQLVCLAPITVPRADSAAYAPQIEAALTEALNRANLLLAANPA